MGRVSVERVVWKEPRFYGYRRVRRAARALVCMAGFHVVVLACLMVVAMAVVGCYVLVEERFEVPWRNVITAVLFLGCAAFVPIWMHVIMILLFRRKVRMVRSPQMDFRVNGTSRRASVLAMRVRRFGAGHALLRTRWKGRSGRVFVRSFGVPPGVDVVMIKACCETWNQA